MIMESYCDLPEVVIHKRSKSFPDLNGFNLPDHFAVTSDQRKSDMEDCSKTRRSKAEIKNSLSQEIVHLKKMLNDQVHVRGALENALSYGTLTPDFANETVISEGATKLIRETTVLDVEVRRLERNLLSMYRKVFDEQIPSISPSVSDGKLTSPEPIKLRSNVTSPQTKYATQVDFLSKSSPRKQSIGPLDEEELVDLGIRDSRSALTNKPSSLPETIMNGESHSSHSQPLSTTKDMEGPLVISLAEHLEANISSYNPGLSNKISEDMVKSMSAIYCKFADPSMANLGLSSSSSLLSSSVSSPRDQTDSWSRRSTNINSFDVRLDNPLHVEVHCINEEILKSDASKHSLQNFRTLICQLEYVDPRKMTHAEKLAFWINVHNSLVMHAYLVFGLPRNDREKMILLTKAAYNIGGQIISADVIKNSLLSCRTSYSGTWIRWLLSTITRFKPNDERYGYAIDRSEPLLHFALSSANYYDPVVLVYTPEKVFEKLETAKEEYIRSTIDVKDERIYVPKIVEWYVRDSGLCYKDVMETILRILPDSVRENIGKHLTEPSRLSLKWIPHSFTFRYIISTDRMN